ncbi:MAG: hypothetical protein U0R52_08505 [Solirubrobacterales bacterium]
MKRLIASLLALALGAGTALALVACGGGGSGLLPGDTADQIVANLQSVEKLNAGGDCAQAQSAADEVRSQVSSLGGEVDPRLKRALIRGADRLVAVTANCVETTVAAPDTVEPPTSNTSETTRQTTRDTTATQTTDTQTTPTTPTTTTTTTTPTTPTTTPTVPTTPAGGSSGGVGPGKPAGRPR